ncbi:Glucosyltransferase-like protein [Dimargaris cristalligena]|nr:Glucosyltransferase-like protein [Dimargaris cristalligena]
MSSTSKPAALGDSFASPTRRWFTYAATAFAHAPGFSTAAGLVTLGLAIYVRWAVTLGSYSGRGVQPTYGDYEAQRHWMELTYHLPVDQWYFYSPTYWRLDYPPLSAYLSWLCGAIAHWIDPTWVALDTSRGIETPDSKVFMRATVLVCELIVYVPAVYLFLRAGKSASDTVQWVHRQTLWLLILLQPALILIDHGHFQYNSVMLGLVLWTVVAFQRQFYILGAISFCLALAFKQMALYFAPAVFAFLLGKCFQGPRGIQLFVKLGLTVALTTAICFGPFLGSWAQLSQVLQRIFPVDRGLYEDKVANFWCASNVVLKLRHVWKQEALVKLSAAVTLAALLPACYAVARRPTLPRFLYALAISALAFFLFAFQVHEKSILLPALPITLLMDRERTFAFFFVNVAVFSMYTLLQRDEIVLSHAVCTLFWNWLGGFPFNIPNVPLRRAIYAVFTTMLSIHLLDALVPPPARYPHIYIVANVLLSCGLFGLSFLYLNYRLLGSNLTSRSASTTNSRLKSLGRTTPRKKRA